MIEDNAETAARRTGDARLRMTGEQRIIPRACYFAAAGLGLPPRMVWTTT